MERVERGRSEKELKKDRRIRLEWEGEGGGSENEFKKDRMSRFEWEGEMRREREGGAWEIRTGVKKGGEGEM